MIKAREMGMFDGDYVFITSDFQTKEAWKNDSWMKGKDPKLEFDSFLDLSVQIAADDGGMYEEFKRQVRGNMSNLSSRPGSIFYNYTMPANEKVSFLHHVDQTHRLNGLWHLK